MKGKTRTRTAHIADMKIKVTSTARTSSVGNFLGYRVKISVAGKGSFQHNLFTLDRAEAEVRALNLYLKTLYA